MLPLQLDLDSLQDLSVEDKAELAQARERMASCVRRFLGQEPGTVCSLPKYYRVASYRWLQALDHALWVCTGAGWEQFCSKDTSLTLLQPQLREALGLVAGGPLRACFVAADQMSTGPSGTSFLQQPTWSISMDLLMDPPHRFWNTDKLGLLQAGAWEAVLLTTIPYSINEGPWHSSGFLRQLVGSLEQYLVASDPHTDRLLQSLLPKIARDLGKEEELGTPAFLTFVVRLVENSPELRTKGEVLALCRWFSWVKAHEHWQPFYHLRLFVMLLWAMSVGLLTKRTEDVSLTLAAVPSQHPEDTKETMREQQAKQNRVRSKGKNMLHTSLLILLNPLVHKKANVVYWLLQDMKTFHGLQVQACETPAGNARWSVDMAGGAFAKPVLGAWSLLSNLKALRQSGFACSRTDCVMAGLAPQALGDWSVEEESWVAWVVTVLCSLTRNRLRHLFFYTLGPGMLASLLSSDPGVVAQTLALLQRLHQAYEFASQLPQPSAKTATEKHWMGRPVFAHILAVLSSDNWQGAPPEVSSLLQTIFQ